MAIGSATVLPEVTIMGPVRRGRGLLYGSGGAGRFGRDGSQSSSQLRRPRFPSLTGSPGDSSLAQLTCQQWPTVQTNECCLVLVNVLLEPWQLPERSSYCSKLNPVPVISTQS
ncbi:hypothetical protein MLPF_2443 [Mycobacterium lepromatosis]|nr:hypothetical protein MLPF_2443 [Mycobacterium lepromatosis]